MKIALSPDIHCYYAGKYDVLDKSGNSLRKREWIRIANKMLATCKEQKVDVLIVPGDFFVNPKPTAEQVLLVAKMLRAFEHAGIKVVGITGNHDVGGARSTSMDEVVAEIGRNRKWCYTTFDTTVIGEGDNAVGFAFLPFVKAHEISAYNPDYAGRALSDKLTNIAEGLFEKLGDVKTKILVGHWSIQGAVTSSGKKMESTLTGAEPVLQTSALVEQGWDACMFGHIHVPQVLCDKKKNGPFIAYSGCFQRINVGEAGDARGFYIYNTEDASYSFHALPAIPMKVFSKEISSKEDFDALIAEIKETPLKGRYAYVKYTINKDDFALVDKKDIEKALTEQNPLSIIGIMPKVIYEARQRDATLTESLDGETALVKWLGNKGVDADRVARILGKFREMSDKLNSGDDDEDDPLMPAGGPVKAA